MVERGAGSVGQGSGRVARGRVGLFGIPVGTFCAAEAYVEKALRELALQVLPPTTRGQEGPAAALALGAEAFAELSQQFFDLAENAADFMPVRDEVAPYVQRARADGVTHVDVRVMLPSVCARTSVEFNELLDSVERLSTVALLRTPAPSAEVTRFRHWYLEQIHAQLGEAAPPRPFPE